MKRTLTAPTVLVAALVVLAGCGGLGGSDGDDSPGDDLGSVPFSTAGWKTDFGKSSVPLEEFSSGGPPRDGIPPIDDPKFIGPRAGDGFLSAREPVIVVELDGDARAYPLQVMIWHEIVNDDFGGRPVGVTFCPLCNSSVVFERRLDGETLRFGTTGNLRKSNLVMWDDRTESWWEQIGAEAIVGELTGKKLELLDSQILSWEDFKSRFPDGKVLSRDTGFDRDYGRNPYAGYDDVNSPPFALDDEDLDGRLPPKMRVSAVTIDDDTVVYPFDKLEKMGAVNDRIGDVPVVVLFKKGVRSALDSSSISSGQDVGTSGTFDRRLGGRTLDFEAAGKDRFRDRQTGSTWDITGRALSGPLAKRKLEAVSHDDQFWFAIAGFFPDVKVFKG